MRVLILSPYPPYPPHGGGTMRIFQLIRGLAERHQVTCLTFAPDAAAAQALAPLHAHCRVLVVHGPPPRSAVRRAWTTLASPLPDMALRNASAAYAAALDALLASETFDIIQAESIEMAPYLEQIARLTPRPARLVLDQFNAEHVLQQRAAWTSFHAAQEARAPKRLARELAGSSYSFAQWRKLARYERRAMRVCDGVAAVSEDDQRTLQALQPAAIVGVVPNGVDTNEFSRTALGSERADLPPVALVFSGTLDYRPNIDAVQWFAQHVLPLVRAQRPEAQFVVVGKRPPPAIQALAADPAISVVGEVPDARPYIAGATVYVVPMRIGGGVRLKLLEALSLEAPVASTSMGAEGVHGLQAGEHCLLADQPDAFAAAVLRLMNDRALAGQLGAAGRTLVQARYDWDMIVPQLEQLYERIGADS